MAHFPFDCELILASQSPRRRALLAEAGFQFAVDPPDDSVECAICSTQQPHELVAESSFLKAKHIATTKSEAVVLAADTVAVCQGQILGKPRDVDHAGEMLSLMSGKRHSVLTGVTLWHRPSDVFETHIEETILTMDQLDDALLDSYLDSNEWIGKAGAFGYQDGLDWVHVEMGLESNVVGLPIERLAEWFERLKAKVAQKA